LYPILKVIMEFSILELYPESIFGCHFLKDAYRISDNSFAHFYAPILIYRHKQLVYLIPNMKHYLLCPKRD